MHLDQWQLVTEKIEGTGGKPVHGIMLFYSSELLIPTFLYSMKIKQ